MSALRVGVDIQGVPTSLVSSAKLARYPKLVGKPRRMNNESLSAAFRSFARFINSRSTTYSYEPDDNVTVVVVKLHRVVNPITMHHP